MDTYFFFLNHNTQQSVTNTAIVTNYSLWVQSKHRYWISAECQSLNSLKLPIQVFFYSSVTASTLPAAGGDRVGCGRQKNRKIKQDIKSWNLCKIRETTEQRTSNPPSPGPWRHSRILSVRCWCPDVLFRLKSSTLPGSGNAQTIRPSAIFSSSSSLVLQAAQTGNHSVWEDSVRSQDAHTQVQDLQGSKGCSTSSPHTLKRWTSSHCFSQELTLFIHTHAHKIPYICMHENVWVHIHICMCVEIHESWI